MSGMEISVVAWARNFLSYRLNRDGKTNHASKTTTMIHPSKWAAFAAILCCCFSTITAQPQEIPIAGSLQEIARQAASSESSPISDADIVAAQQFGHSITVPEWLGPMAPVAMSPFFGITCLSGMSLFGGKWISHANPLLGDNSPLHNPAVFWTFLALTILTSIPRLTKVSKPFAQAVDQLEAWSGIVTMITLRMLISSAGETAEVPDVVHAGIFSMSTDILMMLAAAINIFVINAVKFFFEVLIWFTPVPFLDAAFEVCNKTLCAVLMTVYAWSPAFATSLNLAMFVAAAIVFGWIHRRQVFFRTMLLDLVWGMVSSPPPSVSIVVFPTTAVGGIKARAYCTLERSSSGWVLQHRPLLRSVVTVSIGDRDSIGDGDSSSDGERPEILCGFFTNSITFSKPAVQLTFSRLYNANLPQLADQLKVTLPEGVDTSRQRRAEFA